LASGIFFSRVEGVGTGLHRPNGVVSVQLIPSAKVGYNVSRVMQFMLDYKICEVIGSCPAGRDRLILLIQMPITNSYWNRGKSKPNWSGCLNTDKRFGSRLRIANSHKTA
jgi:hypothetical protein